MSYKLTNKETKETVFTTLGRLKVNLPPHSRAMELLNKIYNDVSNMDIELMHAKKDFQDFKNFELYSNE